MTEPTKTLIEEFITIAGMTEVEAHRSAFLVRARYAGWQDAKIGRHLGITRQRVSQRGKRIDAYARENKDMRTLKGILKRKRPKASPNGSVITFNLKDWENLEFARGMLDQVESGS